jgi:hypothetical protein
VKTTIAIVLTIDPIKQDVEKHPIKVHLLLMLDTPGWHEGVIKDESRNKNMKIICQSRGPTTQEAIVSS